MRSKFPEQHFVHNSVTLVFTHTKPFIKQTKEMDLYMQSDVEWCIEHFCY